MRVQLRDHLECSPSSNGIPPITGVVAQLTPELISAITTAVTQALQTAASTA